MYLSDRAPAGHRTGAADGRRRRRLAIVSGNVVALGTVSLVTDVSAEMVTAVLPLYLVLGLNLSPLAYGVIDGVYTGATAVLRLVGGYVADRMRRAQAAGRRSATRCPPWRSSGCCWPDGRWPPSDSSSPSTGWARDCGPRPATR